MRCRWNRRAGFAVILPCAALPARALAGITVTEYRTLAQTNGYAPTSEDQYFARQRLKNTSPAHAQVFGDWMGPNAGGSTNTWHWISSAQATSTTEFDADGYTVTAAGSFVHELTTTAEFVDPSGPSVFSPGSAASYRGFSKWMHRRCTRYPSSLISAGVSG